MQEFIALIDSLKLHQHRYRSDSLLRQHEIFLLSHFSDQPYQHFGVLRTKENVLFGNKKLRALVAENITVRLIRIMSACELSLLKMC